MSTLTLDQANDAMLRKFAMDCALKMAKLYAANGWKWAPIGGIPGPEDIADVILERIERIEEARHESSCCCGSGTGRIWVHYVPGDHLVSVTLEVDELYVGEGCEE